jgi:glycine betaine/proline transport system substrate-binding protein
LAVIGAALVLAACSGSGDDGGEGQTDGQNDNSVDGSNGVSADGAADAASLRGDFKPTVTLGVTDWTAARLNVAIAEEIIERRLGYPIEQAEVTDTGEMLTDLQSGDLHAVLEVWPSSLEPRDRERIDSGAVEELGELGVVGKTGWFVPRYVIEQQPEWATWEAYADRSVAAAFATAETGSRGRFLGTDFNYEQFDEEIIDALDLPFEVVFSGSDQATADELRRAAVGEDPVLLFWWTPTAEVTRFDLVNVELPPRTVVCEEEIEAGRPQSCDYPVDRLQKFGSPLLQTDAPDVHRFLQNFSLTTNDHLMMLDQVENDGRSISDVAGGWVADNQDRWEAWLS